MAVHKSDNAEHEGYVKASKVIQSDMEERDGAQRNSLEAILYKDNLNRAYKKSESKQKVQQCLWNEH